MGDFLIITIIIMVLNFFVLYVFSFKHGLMDFLKNMLINISKVSWINIKKNMKMSILIY